MSRSISMLHVPLIFKFVQILKLYPLPSQTIDEMHPFYI